MAAVGCRADAPSSAHQPPRAWARRAARAAAKHAVGGKLRAALLRVAELEELLESSGPARAQAPIEKEADARLALIRPVVVAMLEARDPGVLARAQRDLAAHCIGIPAERIRALSLPECNHAQRLGRCGPRGLPAWG